MLCYGLGMDAGASGCALTSVLAAFSGIKNAMCGMHSILGP